MNDISKNSYPDPLDQTVVENYLARCRTELRSNIASPHLAQLCNEVLRRRQAEREDRSVGVAELAVQEGGRRLTKLATKAIANVGHSRPFEGHQHEATAIVQVANMLAELMQWRSGERVSAELEGYRQRQTTDHTILLDGGPVHGSKEAVDYTRKLVDELMQWRFGQKRPPTEAAYRFPSGTVIYGKPEVIDELAKQQAELEEWRSGERTPPNMAARDLIPGGMTVRGSAEAMGHLSKLLAELESARRMINELESMGWLMVKAKP